MFTIHWNKSAIIKVSIVLCLVVAVCTWMILSLNRMKAAQAQELNAAQMELTTLMNDAGQLNALKAEFAQTKAVLAHLEPGVPEDRKATYLPTLLKQLQKLADDTDVKLEQLNPGQSTAQVNPTPPAGNPSDPNAAPPPAPSEQKVPLNIRMEGTFAQLMAFLEGLKSFPKVVQIDTMQLQPRLSGKSAAGVAPKLGITMEANATVLPLIPGVGP